MLVVLCVTEIISWGVLYYALPVLAPAISADTGWSIPAVTAAFSAGLVVSGLIGIASGRLLDRIGPRPVMTTGSVLAVPALAGIALAPNLAVFTGAWLLAGVAMSATLYPAAFAALTRWWGPRRVRALTAVTLLAGFASTVFAPLTAALLEPLGWRGTYLVLAAILAVITVPAHLLGLRGPWPDPDLTEAGHVDTDPGRIARSRPFLLLTAALTLAAFSSFAVVVNQVPLFLERGMSTTLAAWALGLGGVGQVLGRLGYAALARRLSVRARVLVVLAALAVTTALLALVPGPAGLLIGVAMLAGAVRGIGTLLQATAISDRWGAAHYGRLNGLLSAPIMVATAVSPWAGAALAGVLGGYPVVFVLLALVAAVAVVLAVGASPSRQAEAAEHHTG